MQDNVTIRQCFPAPQTEYRKRWAQSVHLTIQLHFKVNNQDNSLFPNIICFQYEFAYMTQMYMKVKTSVLIAAHT